MKAFSFLDKIPPLFNFLLVSINTEVDIYSEIILSSFLCFSVFNMNLTVLAVVMYC